MIRFHTNLDHGKRLASRLLETWKGPVPSIGHRIRFKASSDFSLDLEVVAVTFDEAGAADVELHIPKTWGNRSIADWIEWVERHGVRSW